MTAAPDLLQGPAAQLRVGWSTAADAAHAVEEAVAAAREGGSQPRLALVFATPGYPASLLAEALRRALPEVPLAGCITAGVIAGGRMLAPGVAVGLFEGRDLRVGIGVGGPSSAGTREAGRSAVASALAGLPPLRARRTRAILLFTDVLTGCSSDVLRGAVEAGGTGVAWGGGGVGDPLAGRPAVQLVNGAIHTDRVLAVAIDCAGRIGSGIAHGWQPLGPPVLVTRSSAATVHALEYEPAFEVIRRAAEECGHRVTPENFASFATTHPFGIPHANGEYLIRDPVSVQVDGSLRCLGDVPDGALVRVMQGTPEALVRTAAEAAAQAREDAGGSLGAALAFDCVSRSFLLGARVDEELSLCHAALGPVPLLGCLTAGEVGAFGSQVPQFHNKTAVVLAFPA